ncbi:glycine cleavage system protein GcvH [Allochromatium vinosum]|uniref:Glycine cleavage system H protein n=1 Tax=Allochromatium vinosum (strain ATCC 17899 / DSM 180 / NBRC 103801 / NCIMB 10441 / D) TaxID=572477 RepID=D3RR31_ALLVD|nr:glycine cleavage system protein GcvH [Allochromatium vinosum]ADC61859.1 glycine cleavage system H protein [Allochromatium vinosum DSM 180]
MSNLPADLKYTKTHEWVRDNGDGTVTVGITDHAQDALGDIVFVEVPENGRTVAAEDACAVVESVKAASDIYSPIAGEIVEGNAALADTPDAINTSPYGDGWIFRLTPADMGVLDGLLDAAAYEQVVADES